MKKFLLTLIFFVSLNFSYSQHSAEIDSLSKTLENYYKIKSLGKKNVDTLIVDNLNDLSASYYSKGDYDSALYFSSSAQKKSEEISFFRGLARAFLYNAFSYEELGDMPKTLEYNQKCIAVCLEVGENIILAQGYSNLASYYRQQGNYERAMEFYQKSLGILEASNHEVSLIAVYGNIGNLYGALRELDSALHYYLKIPPLAEKNGDKLGLGILYGNIATIYVYQNRFEDAITYFTKSLTIRQELGNKKGIAFSLYGLGSTYFELKQYDKAAENLSQAYDIAVSINNVKMQGGVAFRLFLCYQGLKNHALAEKFGLIVLNEIHSKLKMNFPIFSEKEKELYFTDQREQLNEFSFFTLSHQTINPEITGTLYNSILSLKGILLKSSTALRNAILSSGDKELIADYEKWIELKKEIIKESASGINTIESTKKAEEIEMGLVSRSNTFSDFNKNQAITWKDVQAALKPNEAAIEFTHFEYKNMDEMTTTYAALILTKDCQNPFMIELFNEPEIEVVLSDYRGNNLEYIDAVYGKKSKKNTALYDLIWKPLEPTLKDIKKVYISPSGLLHRVSFAALSKDQDVFLCDNYSIQMVASSGKVALPESFELTEKTTTTIFGGIDFTTDSTDREVWNYLEGTKVESEKINLVLSKKGFPVTYYSSKDATEFAFKKIGQESEILHIATHGFFYPDPNETAAQLEVDPTQNADIKFRGRGFGYSTFVENENPLMRSGLVFAGANDVWSTQNKEGDDGVLTAQEVAHIDLRNTQLVVLSACETGLGDIKGSEGVYGLQRAFKMAGVKFIIMSLWQVPDKETAEFMTLFYKRLIKLKNIHLAFSQTQKAMRAKYDPYYWAAFVLIE